MNLSGLEVLILALSFLIPLLIYPRYIEYMRRLKIGQFIREEGPEQHNVKAGTPTAGGLIFVPTAIVANVLLGTKPELVLTLLFYGLIGLLDDLVSIRKKRSLGLRAWQKLVLQFLFSVWIAYRILQVREPRVFGFLVPEWFFYVFTMFLVSGYSNATNLTDGLDGLAGWTFVSSSLLFMLLPVTEDETKLILALVLPLLAFLIYNTKPARIFMGDTGSLALGAYLATFALMKGWELQLIFFTTIFLVETLSVILQVGSYKLRKKRIFKMSPIHHHFELQGWAEEKVVGVFVAWNIAVGLIALLLFRGA